MPVQEQRPQVSELRRGDPDRGKAIFHQQPQQQARIASIMFLSTGLCLSDRRGMTHAARDCQFLHQSQKPPHGTGGFNAHHGRRWN
jgi:hypothetical protein